MRYDEIVEKELAHTEDDDRHLEQRMHEAWDLVRKQGREVTVFGHLGGIELRRTSYPNGFRIFFFDGAAPIGMAHVRDKSGEGDWYVSLIWLKPEYRRRGLASSLYRLIMSKGVALRPDTRQTAGGKALWTHLRRGVSEDAEVPTVLYHATFEDRVPSIMQHGLGAKPQRTYEVSRAGVVYLSDDPDAAEAYARESQFGQGATVVLEVDVTQLNPARLRADENDEGEFGGHSYEYHGIIPASALRSY